MTLRVRVAGGVLAGVCEAIALVRPVQQRRDAPTDRRSQAAWQLPRRRVLLALRWLSDTGLSVSALEQERSTGIWCKDQFSGIYFILRTSLRPTLKSSLNLLSSGFISVPER